MKFNYKRHWTYFKYICRHKYYVFVEGMKLHVPIYLLIFHDWSKFLPNEWFPYARCFYAKDGTKQYDETYAFNEAWNHHQKSNKHHWQYWMLTFDRGTMICLIMPPKYFLEMVADWKGASRAITGADNTKEWYIKNQKNIYVHPNNRMWIEKLLEIEESDVVRDYKYSLETNEGLWYWSSQGKPK